MIGSVLLLIGSLITVKNYGWQYLAAFVPLWFLFGYFLGIPTIINVLRTRATFTAPAMLGALAIHGLLYFCLVVGIRALGMSEMEGFFLVGGVINAFSMPYASLMNERSENASRM
jgi:hypothetical protein